jgi:hypothetical protein
LLSQTSNKIKSHANKQKENTKSSTDWPHRCAQTSCTHYSMSLSQEHPCVSMCHSKSAQLSHPGWEELENKGTEQRGQPWGLWGELHEATKTRKHNGQGALSLLPACLPPCQGRIRVAPGRQPGGARMRHVRQKKQLQNDDPLKEP